MRICGHCKQFKPLSEFAKKLKGLSSKCKPCIRAYSKEHYERKKELYYQRKNATKKIISKIKSENPCADCNKFYPYFVMDFDHARRVKSKGISNMVGSGIPFKKKFNWNC